MLSTVIKYYCKVVVVAFDKSREAMGMTRGRITTSFLIYCVAAAAVLAFSAKPVPATIGEWGIQEWLLIAPSIVFLAFFLWHLIKAPIVIEQNNENLASKLVAAIRSEKAEVENRLNVILGALSNQKVSNFDVWDRLQEFRLDQVSWLAFELEPRSNVCSPGSGYALFTILKTAVRKGELTEQYPSGKDANLGTIVSRADLKAWWEKNMPDKPRFIFHD